MATPADYNIKYTSRRDINLAIMQINDSVKGRGYSFIEDTDGRYHSNAFAMPREGDRSIIVLASFDFSYYHNLELVFYEVGYTNMRQGNSRSDHWTKDQLELSGEEFPDGFEFKFNAGDDFQYSIRAKALSRHLERISNRRW